MTVRTRAIHGKLIALLRLLYVSGPPDPELKEYAWKFLTGRGPFPAIGLEWYLSPRYFRARRELATMAAADPFLDGADINSLETLIDEFFRRHALHSQFFDGDAIFLRRVPTLFDARATASEETFAAELWDAMRAWFAGQMSPALVIYPLYRFHTKTVDLGFDGIWLLDAHNASGWQQLAVRYGDARLWSPLTGLRTNDPNDARTFSPAPEAWLACESFGLADRARRAAAVRMKTFLGVCFAQTYERTRGLLLKSSANGATMSTQFAAGTNARYGEIRASIGPLVPPLLTDVVVSDDLIRDIRAWYTARANATPPIGQRATVASHFVQYAIVNDDLERFLHFFIALDALYGVRGDTERTITRGVVSVFSDPSWERRCNYLFDLRSELVHGGTSDIEAWPRTPDYFRHFNADPDADTAKAAMTCLRDYFTSSWRP